MQHRFILGPLIPVKLGSITVLGFSVGWCNPIDLGVGSQGIPPDFTVNKVEERIHFRGEGKIFTLRWKCYGVVCVS